MLTLPSVVVENEEPVWEMARLFPLQGAWTEDDYLEFNENRLLEFSNGRIEVLPMPTTSHQRIVAKLFRLLERFVLAHALGEVLIAPLRVRTGIRQYREPDIVFLFAHHADRAGEAFWDGADLVMEVVSPEGRTRDTVKKRHEYARAGIPEYWVVDPEMRAITVYALDPHKDDASYVVHGDFGDGQEATSRLLPGFRVDVQTIFAV